MATGRELAITTATSNAAKVDTARRHLARRASRPAVEDVIARARSRAGAAGTVLDPSEILAARDADRR